MLEELDAVSKYIRPDLGTTDYALLFFPTDNVWHQAFVANKWYGEENPIPSKSQQLRVFGCSAQTLLPYLGLIRLGLRNLRIAEDVKGTQGLIDQLRTAWSQLKKSWDTLLGHLQNAYNLALGMLGPKGSLSQVEQVVDNLSKVTKDSGEPNRESLERQLTETGAV